MPAEIVVKFSWIPAECGGHRADPWPGMRPTIRWQRYVEAWLERIRDAQCEELEFDGSTRIGLARMQLMSDDPLPSKMLQPGELVELLDGSRVIAVGKIETLEKQP
ncbi:MAG: hypothetical protein D6746_09690 [Bacteroidetes bacterium]|nr:MAG: hypothetical protein D6746_09690 [Bacteroidota bacterium]